jgi:hypothetical protein
MTVKALTRFPTKSAASAAALIVASVTEPVNQMNGTNKKARGPVPRARKGKEDRI